MTKRGPLSLRTRFVLAAVACVIPLAVVAVVILLRSLENNENQLIETEATIGNVVSNSLQASLLENQGVLTNLAAQSSVQNLDVDEAQPELLKVTDSRQTIGGLMLLEVAPGSGPTVVTVAGVDGSAAVPGIQDTLARTLSGETAITGPITVNEVRYIVLAISVPTSYSVSTIGGQNPGILAALLKIDRLTGQVTPWAGADTVITVVSQDAIIASSAAIPDEAGFLRPLARPIEQALAGEDGTYSYESQGGNERLAVFTPVEFAGTPWAVLVTSSSPRSFGPNRDLFMQGLVAIGVACVLALAAAWGMGIRAAGPLRRLTTKAEEIARGQFTPPIKPEGATEVRQLGQAFSEMEATLASNVADLQQGRRELDQTALALRDLHRRTVRLQEDERRRIASEIHDAVSPLITGALYQARALRLSNGSTPQAQRDEGLDAVGHLLEQAGEELHGVIFELRPPDLDELGVVPAIERYIQTIQRTGLTVHFDLIGEPPTLTPEIRLGIYRIVQEALHNVVRHADADEATVKFDASGDSLRVTIRDNGSGFDTARAGGPTSLGLLSMRERATAIGATFSIASKIGGGTVIVIERTSVDDLLVREPGVPESPSTAGVQVRMANGSPIVDTSPMDHGDANQAEPADQSNQHGVNGHHGSVRSRRPSRQEAPPAAGLGADAGVL